MPLVSSFGVPEDTQTAANPAGRLGVYQDGPFHLWRTGRGDALVPDPVDAPFLLFVRGVGAHFDTVTVFARVVGDGVPDTRLALPESYRVVRLPDYGSLRRIPALTRAAAGTARAFWRGLRDVDVVWAFGPHPLQLLLVALAVAQGKRVVLGVRQDTPAYFRARLPGPRWKPLLAALDGMDWLHRLIARRLSATVVGPENLRRYASPNGRLTEMRPSLVTAADVVPAPSRREWSGELELLSVGRIDAEKNPLLLVEAIAELERRRPGRYRLTWVGVGPLAAESERRAEELGLADRIRFEGYVPFGPGLLALYRRAHVFVHVSLTEGVPQVLVEALASGTPIVATDVGGVAGALDNGRLAVLVPPADLAALVSAIVRLSDDTELRSRLAVEGIEAARGRTLEAEADRVARFLRGTGTSSVRD
jgi:glycosyltransferase involved in cell wall biosynthesis